MKLWIARWLSRLQHLLWRCKLLLPRLFNQQQFYEAEDESHTESDQHPTIAAGFTPLANRWVLFAVASVVLVVSIGSFII